MKMKHQLSMNGVHLNARTQRNQTQLILIQHNMKYSESLKETKVSSGFHILKKQIK